MRGSKTDLLCKALDGRARDSSESVRMGKEDMPRAVAILLMAVWFITLSHTAAYPGHELPYYPSYYPQEIRIESIEPGAAATLLRKSALHAYVGADPFPSEQI